MYFFWRKCSTIFFTSSFSLYFRTTGINFRIIRRRVIWLIGQWTSVKFDQSLRPKVYEVCLHLLQSNEDICVRLASCKYVQFNLLILMKLTFFFKKNIILEH